MQKTHSLLISQIATAKIALRNLQRRNFAARSTLAITEAAENHRVSAVKL
jgi:hypothetical protein